MAAASPDEREAAYALVTTRPPSVPPRGVRTPTFWTVSTMLREYIGTLISEHCSGTRFSRFPRDIGFNSVPSQLQGFRNSAACPGQGTTEDRWIATPKSRHEIAGLNWGTKFDKNGGFLRPFRPMACRIAYRCVKEPTGANSDSFGLHSVGMGEVLRVAVKALSQKNFRRSRTPMHLFSVRNTG